MSKTFKPNTMMFPMPVLMISTFDEKGTPDVMMAAWGTLEDTDCILLELTKDHKTSKNILEKKCFTVSFADKDHIVGCDYCGIASGNNTEDKIKKSGLRLEKSKIMDAPLLVDLPVTLECELSRIDETNGDFAVFGKVKEVVVRDDCLNEKGRLDVDKCHFVTFSTADNTYREVSKVVEKAFSCGLKLR